VATYQYRIASELDWQATSGNALLVISNPVGSGKKLTLRSFELSPLTYSTTGTAGTVSASPATCLSLARVSVGGSDIVTPAPLDSGAAAWPATVRVLLRSSVGASPLVIHRVAVAKQYLQASLSFMGRQRAIGQHGGIRTAARRGSESAVEGFIVRAGEALALYASTLSSSIPVRVMATIVRSGSPDRTYMVEYFTNIVGVGSAVFAIDNAAGSGEIVTLRSIAVEEVGLYDTSYFQLVPVGSVEAAGLADPTKAVLLQPMDTSYPSASSWIKAYANVCILPFGMPENAFAQGSAGSPQGFNYLKTKDFLGPVYRTIFPEYVHQHPTKPDQFASCSHHQSDLMVMRSGITIREGEAIALVSGAETAVGLSAAVGVSGWQSWHICATVTVDPKLVPTLTLTGLQNPSEVRVFNAGTTTAVAGQENVTGGTFAWQFDPGVVSAVDIAVLSLGYQNMRLMNLALALADLTVPIQQQIDRQYSNPA
jgi:hypothetical protein